MHSYKLPINISGMLGMQPLDVNLSSAWTRVESWTSNLAESHRKLKKVLLVRLFTMPMLGVP